MYVLLIIAAVFVAAFVLYRLAASSQAKEGYESISPEQARELLSDEGAIFLDVRTPEEIAAGSIDKAVQIDVMASGFSTKVDKLDKTKTYVVYCRSGRRSANACNIMSKKGFGKLHNLKGGYLAWT